jgi:hypothetical protein
VGSRLDGWERRLMAEVAAARSRPFKWGEHDCVTWAFEVRQAITGIDDASRWRGRYSSAAGAVRVMRRLGWSDYAAAGIDLLGEPLGTPLLAQRGDIVLAADGFGVGVCVGAQAAGVNPQGFVLVPLRQVAMAWRV